MVVDKLLPPKFATGPSLALYARSIASGMGRYGPGYISRFNKRQRIMTKIRPRFARSYTNVKRKKKTSSGRGVTFQRDARMIYRRRRMPRGKRRRWVRFRRKVEWIDENNLGTRTVLFNKGLERSNSTSGNHGEASICLYGWQNGGTIQTWNNDLTYIANLENDGSPDVTSGNTVFDNQKMFFHSGVLDVTMRNTSTKDGELDGQCTLEVDIYEMTMRKETEINGTNYGTIYDALNQTTAGIYNQNTSMIGTPVDLSNRGVTPFEMNKALSALGIKIWKKTKYYISSGQTITYQIRDPKRHKFYRAKIAGTGNGCNKPGVTRHLLVIFKSVPGISVGSTTGLTQEKLYLGVTRKYMYKIEGVTDDRSIIETR